MQIEERSLNTIHSYDRNPRVNDPAVDAVAASIREFGFRQAIVVDEESVIVVGCDERRQYEQAKREQAMECTRVPLAKLQQRVAGGTLTNPEQIGAAAARALLAHHGYCYYCWEMRDGVFHYGPTR